MLEIVSRKRPNPTTQALGQELLEIFFQITPWAFVLKACGFIHQGDDSNAGELGVSYMVGKRDLGWAREFMLDCAQRIVGRPQITTDAHKPYLKAVEEAFGADCDYAQLHKIYGASTPDESRYSPATCIGCDMKTVMGDPDPEHVSTSYVERQNLTMRMSMRRFTRLTNGFSKKLENHGHAVALYFMHYNFCRVHKTLRVTPAMEAGLTDHVWSLLDVVNLLESKALSVANNF
jgi:hypothetical protein